MFSISSLISACIVCHSPYPLTPAICPDCIALLERNSSVGREGLTVFSHDWRQLRVLGVYDDLLAYLITQGKFNSQPEIFKHLALVFCEQLKPIIAQNEGTIVSVPMAFRRRVQRGFNQADIIAKYLSKELAVPYDRCLVTHTGDTRIQHTLSRSERLNNRSNAFRCSKKSPQRVFIIDDVVTTGATVKALCQCLKKAGADYVEVWALAVTEK